MKPNVKNKWYEDINGDTSHKRIIAMGGTVLGYLVAISVVVYGMFNTIASPSTVTDIVIAIVGAPFIALVATVFEKKGAKNDDPTD